MEYIIEIKVINNLTELSNVLSSDKSRIVEISTYYLNGTDTSYYEIIQNVKNILDKIGRASCRERVLRLV